MEIKFGTDGFRGIIAKEFTFKNVERISKAIASYIIDKNKTHDNKILVGYDPRFMSYDFASFCSEIFIECGFSVYLSDSVVPTPTVAYASKDYCGAVMFTASHNPPNYQGIKFIPNYQGPAAKEITDKILTFIDKPIQITNNGSCEYINLKNDYFSHIEKIIDFKSIRMALI